MSIKTYFKGKPASQELINLGYNPQQQQLFSQLGQMGMQGLQDPTKGFEPIQQETMRQFNQDVMPSIMSRIGALGGGHSSSYGQAGTQAGQDLMTRLNAQKAQFGQNNIQNYMNMIQQGLTRQNETMYHPRQQGFGERIGRQFGENFAKNLTTDGPDFLAKLLGGTEQGGGLGNIAKFATMFGA